uniref:Retrovirus-related Pol polyprotein from transposon TNT 1-94 n=1 Tax=Cannabis sativa TaxID=3483 RepID=A0A803P7G2_CANSA
MDAARFEINKFNGTNDFGLWRIKMKAFLVHNGISEAIDEESLKEIDDEKKKKEIETKAHSVILLSLGDEVLREVSSEDKALGLWNKLKEEDLAIILLSSLPRSYEHFVDTMLDGEETLTMFEVKVALNSKEIQKKTEDNQSDNCEGLFARGKTQKKDSKSQKGSYKGNQKSNSKDDSRGITDKKCFYCENEGHFRDECLALKAKLKRDNREFGIERHKSAPRTPQQNGLAERMNITLIEKVRCMLKGAGLERRFWEEAVKIACYLVNRSPSDAIGFKTPQEMWTCQAPSLENLRMFECIAYAHVKQDKLQPKVIN